MSAEGKKILELRRLIPSISGCPKGCHECCYDVEISFSFYEWSRIKDKRMAHGGACPYLGKNGCDIYEDRPIICRLYGTKGMPIEARCPHHDLLKEVRAVNCVEPYEYSLVIFAYYGEILNKTGRHGPFADICKTKHAAIMAQCAKNKVLSAANKVLYAMIHGGRG
jgi:hypothetical protein